jgi:pilus assembly protein FimV
MPHKRPRILLTLLALAALAGQAQAIGFGAGPGTAVLGQTLDQRVGVRLDPGERLAAECVSAEVKVGDVQLPASVVQARLVGEGDRPFVRVVTLTVIDEPVVTLAVSLGCPARLSRRFTVFADPAPASAPSVPVMAAAELATASAPAADVAGNMRTAVPSAAPSPSPTTTPRPSASPTAAVRASSPARPPRSAVRRSAKAAAPVARAASPRPRLKLDAAEPPPPPSPQLTAELIQAAASAAAAEAAAQATAQANAAADARVAAMEKAIEKLRVESAADREALRVLRQRAVQDGQAAMWMPVLAGLVLLLAGLAAWLWLKLRRLQMEKQQSWWNAAAVAAADRQTAPGAVPTEVRTDAAPLQSTASASVGLSSGSGSSRPGVLGPVFTPESLDEPATEPPMTALERTQTLPVGWRDDSEPQRDVSIEELIDLEQQAEFFIVLGQEEAAIDLLVDHLRSTGGGSPLPYLKLLEIYRRRGDREAYDRTRARFNHRFNAYAPDWDADTQGGRLLEDYPSIVARLQMAWSSPIDAMAELESLLFRKSRGELFDMPAYRDVLFLYSLARDLLDREPLGAGNVDVLLPINDGSDFTQPMSLDSQPGAEDSDLMALDNPPTVPVDLDVTQPVMPESLFGENATDPGIGGGRRRR